MLRGTSEIGLRILRGTLEIGLRMLRGTLEIGLRTLRGTLEIGLRTLRGTQEGLGLVLLRGVLVETKACLPQINWTKFPHV